MKSGYKVLWTENALAELEEIIEYLEENWSINEVKNFAHELDHTIELISKNPELFQASNKKKNIRRAVILSLNSLYYRRSADIIEILSLFSNRKNPNDLKI
tara:strand:+ start:19005 stop:19307 length:303 start_codon:yes stop_codon:yes gene_type:complete